VHSEKRHRYKSWRGPNTLGPHDLQKLEGTRPTGSIRWLRLRKQAISPAVAYRDHRCHPWDNDRLNCIPYFSAGVKLGGDPAPLIWDPLHIITDPVPHNWDPAPFCWDPTLCSVESKQQTLFKCHKSQTECLQCSKTPGNLTSALGPLGSSFGPSRLKPRAFRDRRPLAE